MASSSRACPAVCPGLAWPRTVDHVHSGQGPHLRAVRSKPKRGATVTIAAAVAAGAAAAQQAARSSLSTLLISVGIFVMTCAVAVFLICAVPTLLVRGPFPVTATRMPEGRCH